MRVITGKNPLHQAIPAQTAYPNTTRGYQDCGGFDCGGMRGVGAGK